MIDGIFIIGLTPLMTHELLLIRQNKGDNNETFNPFTGNQAKMP